MGGRIRVDVGVHFAPNDAAPSEQYKPLLDDFARAIRTSHSDAVVTVKGFADPSGSTGCNQRLGQRRAESVRADLVSNGGQSDAQVRAVSYGESRNRQVRPSAVGENRRVYRW